MNNTLTGLIRIRKYTCAIGEKYAAGSLSTSQLKNKILFKVLNKLYELQNSILTSFQFKILVNTILTFDFVCKG